jgi:hypothetical protein
MKQINRKTRFIHILRWIGGLILFFIAIVVMVACMGNTPATADNVTAHVPSSEKPTIPPVTPTKGLDFSTTHLSENGLFLVSYTSSESVVPVNQMHQWTLHVETVDGELVENAAITVNGDMPEHGHVLPTRPQVTEYLGNGDYLVEGMKFQMGGWWVMDFTITTNGHTDAVHFNMKLN